MAFDHNAMAELAALKRSRGWGRRKDGIGKTVSTKAYHDRQTADMTAWQRLVYETTVRWKQSAAMALEHYRVDCRFSQKGFYYGDEIPF